MIQATVTYFEQILQATITFFSGILLICSVYGFAEG